MIRTDMADLEIPDAAARYILLQRSYFRSPVTAVYRHVLRHLPVSVPIFNLAAAVESRLRRASVRAAYALDMQREYAAIKPVLPARCRAILDVGCGVAGIDVLLARHYAEQRPELFLLDRSQTDASVYYLFRRRAAFYNSLAVAGDLLRLNGIPADRVHLLEATSTNEIAITGPVDLVLSLISWGFHYPVDVYADRIRALLAPDGALILDVRKGTDGLDALRRRFGRLDVLSETAKQWRVVARP